MEFIASFVGVAFLVEAIVLVIKSFFPEDNKIPGWTWMILSSIIGVVLCVLSGLNFPAIVGISIQAPYVNEIITGLICSRGANFLYDLWSKINKKEGD